MVAEILEMFDKDPYILVSTTSFVAILFSLFSVFLSVVIDDWRDESAHIASNIIICMNLLSALVMTFFLAIAFYASIGWIVAAIPLALIVSGVYFFIVSQLAFDIHLRTHKGYEERSNFKFIKPEKNIHSI